MDHFNSISLSLFSSFVFQPAHSYIQSLRTGAHHSGETDAISTGILGSLSECDSAREALVEARCIKGVEGLAQPPSSYIQPDDIEQEAPDRHGKTCTHIQHVSKLFLNHVYFMIMVCNVQRNC